MVAQLAQWMNLRPAQQPCKKCKGLCEYVYGLWFKCRDCGHWQRGW